MSYQDIAHHYEDGPEDPTPPAFIRKDEHTARKAHGCGICEGTIWPGQRYRKSVWLDDDGMHIYKSHADRAECEAGRQEAEAYRQAAWEAEGRALDREMEELARETAAVNGELYYAVPRPVQPAPTPDDDPEDLPF